MNVCSLALQEISRYPIDELRLQPTFMEEPPPDVAAAIDYLRRNERMRWGRLKIHSPSKSAVNASLDAGPYLKSVALLEKGRLVLGIADAADEVDFITSSERWPDLRRALTGVLGTDLRETVEELDKK